MQDHYGLKEICKMQKLSNKRNFNYDMKKLLGLEQPAPPSELVVTISGLQNGQKWAGLSNGTHYLDIEETNVSTDKHVIKFDPGIPKSKTSFGTFEFLAIVLTSDVNSPSFYYRYTLGVKKAQTGSGASYESHTTNYSPDHPVSGEVTALGCRHFGCPRVFTFLYNGDYNITVSISIGSLWSKGNM